MKWALLVLPFCCATAWAVDPGTLEVYSKNTYDYYSASEVPIHNPKKLWDASEPGKQYLDLFLPLNKQRDYPILIFVHGGGWTEGNRLDPSIQKVGDTFARHGVGVALVDYRTEFTNGTSPYPQDVKDVAQAIHWVSRLSRHVTNPNGKAKGIARTDWLFLGGHSAGGHLVALVTTDSHYLIGRKHGVSGPDPKSLLGVISLSGVYDVSTPSTNHEQLFGTGTHLLHASPLWHAQNDSAVLPPFLLFDGKVSPPGKDDPFTYDIPHAREQAQAFYKALHHLDHDATPPYDTQLSHVQVLEQFANDNDPDRNSVYHLSHHFIHQIVKSLGN